MNFLEFKDFVIFLISFIFFCTLELWCPSSLDSQKGQNIEYLESEIFHPEISKSLVCLYVFIDNEQINGE